VNRSAGGLSITAKIWSFSQNPELKTESEAGFRRDVVALLQIEVAAMNVENFVVRTKRRLVKDTPGPSP